MLALAVRPWVILKSLGLLLLSMAVMPAIPALAAFGGADWAFALRFAIVTVEEVALPEGAAGDNLDDVATTGIGFDDGHDLLVFGPMSGQPVGSGP